ncbi:MAG: copper resistance protein CopC [Methylobacter sp.]|nr:copper resistance protein CopC [Methylobacter sp.]
MKNIFQLSLLVILLIQPQLVFAHAVVTDHSLKIATLQPERQQKVELTFNSQIELGLSQIFLVHKGDKHELLHAVKGNRQGHIIVDIPPLKSGQYALRFKIFAADGHLTEDVIHFTVDALPSEAKTPGHNANSNRF